MTATIDAVTADARTAPAKLSFTLQRLFVWSSVPLLVCVFVGLAIAGWLPPPSPGRTMAVVQRDFVDNTARIRVGCLLMMLTAPLWLFWTTAISLQMRRIEGRLGPLSLVQLATGWIGVAAFMAPPFLWLVAAYRADIQSAQVTYLLNDLAWFGFVGTGILAAVQQITIAVAIFSDRNDTMVLPRWLGYGAVWVSIIFIPGFIVFFFFHGLFAWNGLLAFWLPGVAFGLWWIPLIKFLLKAINREEAAARA
jgi:hypothetical protein